MRIGGDAPERLEYRHGEDRDREDRDRAMNFSVARSSTGAVTEREDQARTIATTRARRPARRGLALLGFSLSLVFGASGAVAHADARTDYLVRLLQTSEAFRVRAQAAISLGRMEASPESVQALAAALGDDDASVRAASAASLERLGDPSVLDALRERRNDRDGTARSAIRSAIAALERAPRRPSGSAGHGGDTPEPAVEARYYVGIGDPASNDGAVDADGLREARGYLEQALRGIDGVRIAPAGEANVAAQRVVRREHLTCFFLDCSVVSLGPENGGTRAVVSVILATYPGRDMRAMLRGAATVPGATGASAERMAIQGAIRGALRRLPQAMEASASR